ncbi:hypothetical protein [Pseudaestuariivita sp.]|uniref:hypothetical protein n=1 Tax=Pseudaestuariivita sp. TaxID=2211669 RepID=UPI0040584B98
MRWLVACLALSACAAAPQDTLPDVDFSAPVVTILGDEGGNPGAYRDLRARLAASGTRVQLGECNSACTMLMTLPNACLIPDTRFGFHTSNVGGLFNPMLAETYRAGILARFQAEWSQSERIQRITAEEAVALDPGLRLCGG